MHSSFLLLALVAITATNLALFASADECFEDFIDDECCIGTAGSTLLANISSLSNLKSLTLRGNSGCIVYEKIPFDEIFMLTQLTHLSLRPRYEDFEIVPKVGWERLTNLQYLNFGEHFSYSGHIPNFAAMNATLQYLNMQGLRWKNAPVNTQFSFFPSSLGELTMLTYLKLPRIHILEGMGGEAIGNLTNLKVLHIEDKEGLFPGGLNNLKKLEELKVFGGMPWRGYSNQGTLPNLSGLSNLRRLTIEEYDVVGSIPASWGGLTALTMLVLTKTHLEGSLPSTLTNLSNLKELHIGGRPDGLKGMGFTGSIPSGLAALSKLTSLSLNGQDWLSNPGLDGTFPESICLLTDLVYLNIEQNSLTGSVPESITNLRELQYFNFAENQLTSTLPAGMASMSNLEVVLAWGGDMQLMKPSPNFPRNMSYVNQGIYEKDWVSAGKRCDRLQDGECCSEIVNVDEYVDECMDGAAEVCLDSGFCIFKPEEPEEGSTNWIVVLFSVIGACAFGGGVLYYIQRAVKKKKIAAATIEMAAVPVGVYVNKTDVYVNGLVVAKPTDSTRNDMSISM